MPAGANLLLKGSAGQHPSDLYPCEIMNNARDAAGRGGVSRLQPGVHLQKRLQRKEVLKSQKLEGIVHGSEVPGQLSWVQAEDLLNGAALHQLQKQRR